MDYVAAIVDTWVSFPSIVFKPIITKYNFFIHNTIHENTIHIPSSQRKKAGI